MEAFGVWYMWLAVALIALILEIFVSGFFIACFSVGALVTALAAALGAGIDGQLIVFAAATLAVIVFLRPFAIRYLHTSGKGSATNNDALIGRTGRVVTAIDNENMRGEVKVDGDIFPARSHKDTPIPVAADVKIVALESITLIVEPLSKEQARD